ncbi:hypothetical protein D3C86_1564070 [compost metagenome]
MIFQLREYPEALGIAFEIEEVIAFDFAHGIQPATAGGLLEPVPDGVFAGVAEGRVADVVGQAGRLHDHPQVTRVAPVGQGIADGFTDAHAQRAADATDFQRVGQARVDVIVTGDWMNLRLAPEAAKRSRKNDAVVVFVERAAAEFFRAVQWLSEAFASKQSLPIQGWCSPSGD